MSSVQATHSGRSAPHFRQDERNGGVTNVGHTERLISQIGGGFLVALGIERGGLAGLTLVGLGGALFYRGYSGHCHLYQTLGVNSAETGPNTGVPPQAGIRVEEAITIQRPPAEVFRFWRDYENMPRFMEHVESVTGAGTRSHWLVKGPMDNRLEWDAEIFQETPNELIAWRSLPGADVDTAGSIHFLATPDGRGTEIHVNQKFNPPGGKLGVTAGKLLGFDPAHETRASLVRLKQLLETGTIPTKQA